MVLFIFDFYTCILRNAIRTPILNEKCFQNLPRQIFGIFFKNTESEQPNKKMTAAHQIPVLFINQHDLLSYFLELYQMDIGHKTLKT